MFRELNILKIFLESPTKEFNVREASRELKITPATASKFLKEYAKKSILIERKDRNFIFYKANLDSELYKDIKIFYSIRRIKDSGFIDEINKFYMKPAIILFGSARYGLDTAESDFDIAVISESTKEFPKKQAFEKILRRKIHLILTMDIKSIENKHLINNILNGIVLQGDVK